jgi:hypothetical protein
VGLPGRILSFLRSSFASATIPTRVDDTIAIAALFQAIVAKLDRLIEKNLGFRLYQPHADSGEQMARRTLRP